MKILHLISQYPSKTGSGVYLTQVYKNLKLLGHTQKVLFAMNSDDIVKVDFDDYNIIKFKTEKLDFPVVGMSDIMPYESSLYKNLNGEKYDRYISEFKENIIKIYNEFKPDIIFTNHLYIMSSIVGNLKFDCKVYGFCHGTCLRQLHKNTSHSEFVIDGIRKLDGIFALSEMQKEEIVDVFSYNPKDVFVIGGGYDKEFYFRKDYKKVSKNDEIRIIYAGKFSRSKGVIYLLKSFDLLRNKYNIKLVLAGAGTGSEARQILDYVDKLGDSVELHGYMSMKDIGELFRTCDIFAMPSLYEGLSLVTIEAMACGLNIVTNKLNNLLNFVGEVVYKSPYMEVVNLPELYDTDKIREEDEENHILNWRNHLENQILNTCNNNFISDEVYNRILEISWGHIIKTLMDDISQ